MTQTTHQRALIYCRVSSKRQEKEGHGLESQEHRCRTYAEQKGYEVESVFQDSYSGGGDFLKRPAMAKMLEYLDSNTHQNYVIVFDDLKRFARDTVFHWKLRTELESRGARPECLNFTFEETPEGEFIETILAAQGELERKQNKRQIVQKMKARLEAGFWPFYPPPGYVQVETEEYGKLLTPDEPTAAHIREALEGFASGRFQSRRDVQRFLKSKFGRHVYSDQVKRILQRSIYTGHIEYSPWGVSLRKGKHEPLISLKTYQSIQERISERGRAFSKEHLRKEFPLRGFASCSLCRHPFTGSFSRGRCKHYPYYHCHIRKCPARGRTIPRDRLEGIVVEMLKEVEIQENVLRLGEQIIDRVAGDRRRLIEEKRAHEQKELKRISEEVDSLVQRCASTKSESVIRVYETKIEELERRRLILESNDLEETCEGKAGTPVEKILRLLKNPYSAWQDGDISLRSVLLKLVFDGPFVYDRETGAGTLKFSYGVRFLKGLRNQTTQDVEMLPDDWNQLKSWLEVAKRVTATS